jgi:hypothetical protein
MTVAEYKSAIAINGFDEFPKALWDGMVTMESFIDYQKCDNDLKIHLVTVSLNRNFSAAGGYEVLTDHYWLLKNFLASHNGDLVKPWLTKPISESIQMIVGDDHFSKYIIGTSFMFGVIEFYAKYLLGYRPNEGNSFDKAFHETFRAMTIEGAFIKLKKTNTGLARLLNKVDELSKNRLKEFGIDSKGWNMPTIAERLAWYRSQMLHGEQHSYYSIGKYLCVLYMLLHLTHRPS